VDNYIVNLYVHGERYGRFLFRMTLRQT